MSDRRSRWETTLKGMGPRRARGGAPSEEVVRKYRRIHARYEWFSSQIQAEAPFDLATCHRLLSTSDPSPGRLELAMVALSLSTDPVATVILEMAISPLWNQEMSSFHKICLHRALGRARKPWS
jgi:hypothetical protein